MTKRTFNGTTGQITAILCVAGALGLLGAQAQESAPLGSPFSVVDPARELPMKIRAPFTVVAVGDIIQMRTLSQLEDPAIQSWMNIVRAADVSVGNKENPIADLRRHKDQSEDTQGTAKRSGPLAVAADLKTMGFDMMNRASNWFVHDTMDSTNDALEDAGIVSVGSGRNLQDAREARFFETPKGRVGMMGMGASGYIPRSKLATYTQGNAPGLPGINGLRVNRYLVVSQDQFAMLRNLQASLYERRNTVTNPIPPLAAAGASDELRLFVEGRFKVGNEPGSYSYKMNPLDLAENLRSIRNGKYLSDFMIATIHVHDGPSALQKTHYADHPADFLIELAHKAIDNGADMFTAHGEHVLGGVEIYKGKPIFYGLSHFIFELPLTAFNVPAPVVQGYPGWDRGDMPLEVELANNVWADGFTPDTMEGIIAEAHYDGGSLVEVRLYPVEFPATAPLTTKGVPHLATGAVATRILRRVQNLSKPYGTRIDIADNVGVIKIGR